MNKILIKHPRYRDRTVLLATYKILPYNKVEITEGAYKGTYKVEGEVANACPLDTNGTISVRAVPIDKLERIE